jgi:dynein heavy chain
MQDILEEIDPVLEPVLAKAFIKRGSQVLIKLGDKEVDYNQDFKLYITTKLSNPHYTPEISTKAMILNFAVKEDGLEAQLLNTVVRLERPDLDMQKNELVVNVAQGKRTQVRFLYSFGVAAYLHLQFFSGMDSLALGSCSEM